MKKSPLSFPELDIYYADSGRSAGGCVKRYEICHDENRPLSKIRIPFDQPVRKGKWYSLQFLIYPTGRGNIQLGYSRSGHEPDDFHECAFSSVWTECWHQACFSFNAEMDDDNGSLLIQARDGKFPRKMEIADITLEEYCGPMVQPSSPWQIYMPKRPCIPCNLLKQIQRRTPDYVLDASQEFFDFRKLVGIQEFAGMTAVMSCTVDSDIDGKIVLLPLSGDYHVNVFLNDFQILNGQGQCHLLKLPLNKGNNQLTIICRPGTRGWSIRIGETCLGLHTERKACHLPPDSLVSDQYPFPGKQVFPLAGEWELCDTEPFSGDDIALPDFSRMHWLKVQQPQELHWALYHAGKLPHPYHGFNSENYRWIENRSWWLRRRFVLPEKFSGRLTLNLDGADYYAHYWLNESYLGSSEGTYCGVAVAIDDKIKRGTENELLIRLECAGEKIGLPRGTSGSQLLKGHVLAGWEAVGKDFNTAGLLQPIYITERRGSLSLERPFVRTHSLSRDSASLECSVEIRTNDPADYGAPLELLVTVEGYTFASAEKVSTALAVSPEADMSIVTLPLSIAAPRLWWPNGMGKQEMYTASFELRRDGVLLDTLQVPFGIRLVERRQGASIKSNYDSCNWRTRNFYLSSMRERGDYTSGDWNFFINGVPFFVKGCNWMPIDNLGDFSDERYDWHLELAKEAGIQMFRVWGAGIPETDHFYELCDRLGILVMQDFPINVSGRGKDSCLWEKMLAWHIFRLRNHPSLACWCGGNEFSPENHDNAPLIVIASNLVRNLDGSREFLDSSPVNGDFHLYPPAKDPASLWKTELSRAPFVSECGSRGMPEPATWQEILPEAEWNAVLGAVEFNPEKIAGIYPNIYHFFGEFPQEMFWRAEKYADIRHETLGRLATAINLGAAETDRLAIEICRYAYPQNGGLLLWAWKRPWPTVACQLIDGMDRPTPVYYETKRAYRSCWPILKLNSHEYESGKPLMLQAALLDESGHGETVRLRIFDSSLRQVLEKKQFIDVNPVTRHGDGVSFEYQPPDAFSGDCFYIVLDVYKNNELIRNVYYLYTLEARTRGMASLLNTMKTSLKMERLHREGNRRVLRITNEGKIASVLTNLSSKAGEVMRCSDNYFWLDAQESREITVTFKNSDNSDLILAAWNAEETVFEC